MKSVIFYGLKHF